MSELVLQPCPFCAGSSFLLSTLLGRYRNKCTGCGASGAEAATKEEAAAKWNQRPGEAQSRAAGYAAGEDAGSEAQLKAVLAWIETPDSAEVSPEAKAYFGSLKVLAKTLREKQHLRSRQFRYHIGKGEQT